MIKLYHCTKILNIVDILESNKLNSHRRSSNDIVKVCFTEDRDMTLFGPLQLEVDGFLLSKNYNLVRVCYDNNLDLCHEKEVYSTSSITNLSDYLVSINLTRGLDFYDVDIYDDITVFNSLEGWNMCSEIDTFRDPSFWITFINCLRKYFKLMNIKLLNELHSILNEYTSVNLFEEDESNFDFNLLKSELDTSILKLTNSDYVFELKHSKVF